MGELFQQYFNIAFLMGKPQDLPAGRAQLHIGVALALVTYLMALAVPYGVERAFLQALVDLGCTGIALRAGLSLVGRTQRFEQAFGGLCGASAFINLAAVPLFAFGFQSPEPGGASMGVLAEFVLLVWGLSLMAHIIRHAFEVRMTLSVLLSFAFFMLLSMLIASLWTSVPSDRKADSMSRPSEVQVVRVGYGSGAVTPAVA